MAMRVPTLPKLFEPWIAAAVGGPLPAEPKATCADCAMAAQAGRPRLADGPTFEVGLKCCTFYPQLANFMVGQILADPSCAGRAEIEQRIAAGPRVNPLGIGRPPVYAVTYRESVRETFGRVPQYACPFLAQGRCNIADYREATCVTYYCRYQRGAVGRGFWQQLEKVLYVIERELALHCVLELDPGAEAIATTIALGDDQKLDNSEVYGMEPAEYRALRWGRFAGRERELFVGAAELVAGLGWADVEAICGTGLRAHTRLLRAAYRRLHAPSELPERLRLGVYRAGRLGDGRTLVAGYSDQDELEIDDAVAAALPRFDGRPVAEVRAELAAAGTPIADDVLGALVDYQILVPGFAAGGCG